MKRNTNIYVYIITKINLDEKLGNFAVLWFYCSVNDICHKYIIFYT